MNAHASSDIAQRDPLLDVRDIRVNLGTDAGTAHLLRGVSVAVHRGETLGIVGESGSGKSMLIKTILGLIPSQASVDGRIVFDGEDLTAMASEPRRALLGRRVGVVFQNPMTSLNPVRTIESQMVEAVRYHLGMSRTDARDLAVELLDQVGIPQAAERLRDYPHQFSGGMRQRVMIAMALTCQPSLLIADEATTALDVTIQKDILDLLSQLQRDRDMAMILISHDLSVVAGRTDDVVVMYGGRVVDRRPTEQLFEPPMHPYTRALSLAIPRLNMASHTRLPALSGPPPSVYDPVLTTEEADARDLVRWSSIDDHDEGDAPPVEVGRSRLEFGSEIAAVSVLVAEQQAGISDGGDADVAAGTVFEDLADPEHEEGQ